jgi:hypothetical protein
VHVAAIQAALPVDPVAHLEAELACLDVLVRRAVERQLADGRYEGDDDLRTLYVPPTRVHAALDGRSRRGDALLETWTVARAPLAAALDELAPDELERRAPLAALWLRFGLDPLARLATALALAPELDGGYRRVFGHLHDDAARGRAGVALALELVGGLGPGAARLRRTFAPDGVVARYRLVNLTPPEAPLLERSLAAPEWLVERALGEPTAPDPDGRLVPIARGAGVPAAAPAGLRRPTIIVAADATAACEAAAGIAAIPAWALDLGAIDPAEATDLIARGARQARADGAALVVHGADALAAAPLDALAADGLRVLVAAPEPLARGLPPDWPRREPAEVTASRRAARWRSALHGHGVRAAPGAVRAVADGFALELAAIDAAAARVAAQHEHPGAASRRELAGAARAVTRHALGALGRPVCERRGWDDLILPPAPAARVREIAAAVRHRRDVLERWGFDRLPGARGIHVLFAGPSGTGKTLAASVIASEAGHDLYVVDLARVVDKYLGETEKQLDRVLREAHAAQAMLLFDEADALFGRRGEVREARDRWANFEVAYLLQRLEQHDGAVILATNLGQQLDAAFARRLHRRVDFPLPDAGLRRRLWRAVFPPTAPLARELDLDDVAARFELSGGAIRNAALSAAYLACAESGTIELRHIVRAVARELEKAGRAPTRAEFGELHPLIASGP